MNKLEQDIIDYWNRQPCQVNRSNKLHKTVDYYEDIANNRNSVEDLFGSVAKFVNVSAYNNKKVLEIGCGIGSDAVKFAEAGAEYTGLDVSNVSIEYAKERFTVLKLPGNFINANAADIKSFKGLGKQDLVFSDGVIHHWPDLQSILSNIYNILDDNGEFIFSVYAKNSWKHALSLEGLERYEAQAGCPYIKLYDLDEIEEFLNGKFKIIDTLRDGLFMYNVENYKKNKLVLEPWFESMSDKMKFAINKHLGYSWYIKAKKV